jgi:hypothetical protein
MNYPELVIVIAKRNPIVLYEMSEGRGLERGLVSDFSRRWPYVR